MITWIQTSFGKHHKVLLGLLLGITIISFVFFGAWSSARPGGTRAKSYLGVNLDSARETAPFRKYIRFEHGEDLLQRIDGQQYSFWFLGNILDCHTADALQIPDPNEAQLKAFAERNPDLVAKIKTLAPGEKQDFAHYLNTRWRIERANNILRGPGYALSFESALAWRILNTHWTIETATLANATFSPAITPTEDALKSFHEQHKEDYRVPPRVTLTTATFQPDATDAAAVPPGDAPPTDDELRRYAHGNAQAFTPRLDLAKLDDQLKTRKDEIIQHMRTSKIRDHLAGRISTLLADELPVDAPPAPGKIPKILAATNAVQHTLQPYGKDSIPAGTGLPNALLEAALKLGNEVWRSDVYPLGNNNVVVFFHQKTEPSRIPALEEIRDKITAGFVQQERNRLFNEHCVATGRQLNSALAEGKKFADAATALGLTVKTYPPFKFLALPNELKPLENTLPVELNATAEGSLTPFLRNGADALYAHVAKKETPAFDATLPEVQTQEKIRAGFAAQTAFQAIRAELQGKAFGTR
jgi:hypothetical protein